MSGAICEPDNLDQGSSQLPPCVLQARSTEYSYTYTGYRAPLCGEVERAQLCAHFPCPSQLSLPHARHLVSSAPWTPPRLPEMQIRLQPDAGANSVEYTYPYVCMYSYMGLSSWMDAARGLLWLSGMLHPAPNLHSQERLLLAPCWRHLPLIPACQGYE